MHVIMKNSVDKKSLDELEQEGWKVSRVTIVGFEEGYDEENKQVTFIVYSNGTKEIKHKGWSRYGYKEATYHVPYDPSQPHTANKGKFWR